jgi:multidrug efflux pump subunit AcrA (membrane-fusion protein)
LIGRPIAPLLGALLLLQACDDGGDDGRRSQAGEPPEVTVATPLMKELVEWDEFTGRFAAVQRVEIRPQVSG